MYSAVSGLQAHQSKMDVVGNNIANVNTYGYKSNRATFADVFYSTRRVASGSSASTGGTNPSQVGFGSKVATIDVIHTRAGAATTNRALDVYINGDGFIPVMTADGTAKYTRVGVLTIDAAGKLVDRNGNIVLGLPTETQTLPSGRTEVKAKLPQGGYAGIRDLVPITLDPSIEYTGIEISLNGEVTALKPGPRDFTPAAGTSWLNVQPYTGNSLETKDSALKDGVDMNGEVRMTVKVVGGVKVVTAVFTYDSVGDFKDLAGDRSLTATAAVNWGDALTNGLNIAPTSAADLTSYLDTLSGLSSDGDAIEVTIGNIAATTSTPVMLGQIGIVTFDNQDGLSQSGEDYYVTTLNSGDPHAYIPGQSGTGTLLAGNLEMSNVDLSREFTEMIITQRGFQSNTRMVTVSDEMLQELINMKR
jgi:flagellar hook protein FlgE